MPCPIFVLIGDRQRLWDCPLYILLIEMNREFKRGRKSLSAWLKAVSVSDPIFHLVSDRLDTKRKSFGQSVYRNRERQPPVRTDKRAAGGTNVLSYFVAHGRANFRCGKNHLSTLTLTRKQKVGKSADC